MYEVVYLIKMLLRLPLFLIGIILWAALMLVLTPIYLMFLFLLFPVKFLESCVRRKPFILENFVMGAKKDMAGVRADYHKLFGWFTAN